MKKLLMISAIFLFLGSVGAFGQNDKTPQPKERYDQGDLLNEVYASYGIGSLFFFVDHHNDYNYTTPGTFILGYSRTLSRVVAVGFQISQTNIVYTRTGTSYSSGTRNENNYIQGIANVRFRYLNKPSFCMYSGFGIGVTMDYTKETNGYNTTGATTVKNQKLLPAGQLTLLGFRVGRALSFFGEFGIGTNYILNLGISYKFGN